MRADKTLIISRARKDIARQFMKTTCTRVDVILAAKQIYICRLENTPEIAYHKSV